MPNLIQAPGYAPRLSDDTRNWVESVGRRDGKIRPALLVRVATDTNYLLSTRSKRLYGTTHETQLTKAMMNLALPGQRIPGVQTWSVTESTETVSSAQMELWNCLPVSTKQGTLTTTLEGFPHSSTVVNNYIADSLGVIERVDGSSSSGNIDPRRYRDKQGYLYREEKVKYRQFAFQTFTLGAGEGTQMPNPAIPQGVDNDVPDDGYWPDSATGVGAYFMQIGNEVVRVVRKSGDTFYIPPGGRNITGEFASVPRHVAGEKVKLLGFGPFTGEIAGLGYLNVDDFKPQTCMLRPGTCLVSYEGWGDIGTPSHTPSNSASYAFTGYWFVAGTEPSMDESGVPKIRVDLRSAGWMYEKQRVTPDLLRRAKTQFGQWKIGQEQAAANGQTIWGAADHDRNIPGDWVDYNSWDPSLPGSYPLRIKVEIAQHQEFFDHMMQTKDGDQCEICRQEHKEWLKYKNKPGNADYIKEQRAVGRHIYKSSIRVLREEAGPIKTYIRLMSTLAAAAWDHPAYGTELAQAFTKLPTKLFDNIRNVHAGLIWNGQIQLNIKGENDKDYDWFSPTYTDEQVYTQRKALVCPYEATYDRAPFSQPMQELAAMNGANFWVDRLGRPVFKPRLFNYRPNDDGGQWNLSYGGSISSYSPSLNADSVITQVWVTAKTCFGSELTVISGGTGYSPSGSKRIMFSGLGGNSHGLALTSGVQQTETVSLDNQVLGLSWDTDPQAWGAVEERPDGTKQMNALPPRYDGSPAVGQSNYKKYPGAVKKIKRVLNFFLVRHYIVVRRDPKVLTLPVDSHFGDNAESALKELQKLVGVTADGVWGRATYKAVDAWLSSHKHYIQFDIWWYVFNKRPWEEYLSAITGVPIVMKSNKAGGAGEPAYVPNNTATQSEVKEWTRTFSRSVINAGGRTVDQSIDQATARSIQCNFADPRIQPADVIWCNVPGHLGNKGRPPYTNGIYVQSITRQMDLNSGAYTAAYSGSRYVGNPGNPYGLRQDDVTQGYQWR